MRFSIVLYSEGGHAVAAPPTIRSKSEVIFPMGNQSSATMPPQRVMVVEPDDTRRQQLGTALVQAGYHCICANSIRDALPFYQEHTHMLTILNARLPWSESVVLLTRAAENDWPVLFVTGEAANVTHLRTLFDLPCDVLVHPFTTRALLTAVDNVLALSRMTLRAGSLRLDLMSHRAFLAGEELVLTAQEFSLLEALLQTPGLPVSRETLLRTAWGYLDMGETRTVDVHIQRLRRKLGKSCIETVYKTGYKLKMV